MTRFQSLTDLFVDGNRINRLSVREIAPLCNLKNFYLADIKIDGADEESVCHCRFVQRWAAEKGKGISNDYNDVTVRVHPADRFLLPGNAVLDKVSDQNL